MKQTKCQKCRSKSRIHTQGRLHRYQLSVIDDALLQAMPHIKHTLIQFLGIRPIKFCTLYSLPHFSLNNALFPVQIWIVRGM